MRRIRIRIKKWARLGTILCLESGIILGIIGIFFGGLQTIKFLFWK